MSQGQNIILVTLDTTRADHLGCYGYHRPTSPNIDKLAAESVFYTRAVAPSSWTLPAHASLFTGKFTTSHGAEYDANGPLCLTDASIQQQAWMKKYRARGLSRENLTLASILKEAGYATFAVVAGPWMKKVFGLDTGFDYYDDYQIDTIRGRLAHQVTFTASKLIERSRDKKFFLFLNYFDPHFPYDPPGEFLRPFLPENRQAGEAMTKPEIKSMLYDGEIRGMDHFFGMLLEYLRVNNLYDNTMIIVTSDHGEQLDGPNDHGRYGHGHSLYQEEVHIPLFVKYPAGEVSPSQSDLRLELIDILPLICQRLGVSIPDGIQGEAPPQIEHPILAEVYSIQAIEKEGSWRAIFENNLKFLWNSRGNHKLFDLGNDPHEKVNLIGQEPETGARMLSNMEQYLAELPEPFAFSSEQEVDEQTKKALQSLGYI